MNKAYNYRGLQEMWDFSIDKDILLNLIKLIDPHAVRQLEARQIPKKCNEEN